MVSDLLGDSMKKITIVLIIMALAAPALASDSQFFIVNERVTATRPSTGEETPRITIGPYTLWITPSGSFENFTHDGSGTMLWGKSIVQSGGKEFVRLNVPGRYATLLSGQPEFHCYSFADAAVRGLIAAYEALQGAGEAIPYDLTVAVHVTMTNGHINTTDGQGNIIYYDVTTMGYINNSHPNKTFVRGHFPGGVAQGSSGQESFEFRNR